MIKRDFVPGNVLFTVFCAATAAKGIASGYWQRFRVRGCIVRLPRGVALPEHCSGKHIIRRAL